MTNPTGEPNAVTSAGIGDFLNKIHSTRRFRDVAVDQSIIEHAIRTAQRAPSTSNLQPYSIVHIVSQDIKQKLYDAMVTQEFVLSAPEWFMVCVDWGRNELMCEELGIKSEMNRESKMMIGVVDASIFAHHFSLALMASGLGVCLIASPYTSLIEVARILDVPTETCMPLHMVVTGYSEEERTEPRPRYPFNDIYHQDIYKIPRLKDVAQYLQAASSATAPSYFEAADVQVDSLYMHYREKFGLPAALRTWRPLERDISAFLKQS